MTAATSSSATRTGCSSTRLDIAAAPVDLSERRFRADRPRRPSVPSQARPSLPAYVQQQWREEARRCSRGHTRSRSRACIRGMSPSRWTCDAGLPGVRDRRPRRCRRARGTRAYPGRDPQLGIRVPRPAHNRESRARRRAQGGSRPGPRARVRGARGQRAAAATRGSSASRCSGSWRSTAAVRPVPGHAGRGARHTDGRA